MGSLKRPTWATGGVPWLWGGGHIFQEAGISGPPEVPTLNLQRVSNFTWHLQAQRKGLIVLCIK